MSQLNMSATVKAIFAGDRATGRLEAALFDDSTSMVPNAMVLQSLLDTLNQEHSGSKDKCVAINLKCNRMSHKQAKELELAKGDYEALAIKLNDDGVFYAEMVATRRTIKNSFMEAAKAFDKSHSQADLDRLMKLALKMLEVAEAA